MLIVELGILLHQLFIELLLRKKLGLQVSYYSFSVNPLRLEHLALHEVALVQNRFLHAVDCLVPLVGLLELRFCDLRDGFVHVQLLSHCCEC